MFSNHNGSSFSLSIIFRSLKYRNYRLFFTGQSISLIGTWMQRIALPWVVYDMTGSAFLLGVVGFAGQVPTFLLSPVAGVLTDRWNRYRVMVVTQVVSMAQAAALAALSFGGVLQVGHVVVLSIIFGCINAFDVPARHSFVTEMVENPDDLGNAIALNSMMFNGARLIGPSVAGVMLATAGEGVCFLLNAVSYIFVIVSLLLMRVKVKEQRSIKKNIMRELKDGLEYTFGFSPIRHIILLLGVISLMGASYQVLMPVFVREILGGESHTFGFLMAAAGSGALIGAFYLASRNTVVMLDRLIPATAALMAAGLIGLSLTRSFAVSVILMTIIGLGAMINTASSNTILQTITDDDKRGRVMSFYSMAIMGTAPFGSLLAGWLAKTVSTQGAILTGGISCLLAAMLFYRRLPELKRSADNIYARKGIIPQVAKGIQEGSDPLPPN